MQNTSNKKHTVDKKNVKRNFPRGFSRSKWCEFYFSFLINLLFFKFEIPRWGFLRAWLSSGRSMGGPGSPSYWVKKKKDCRRKKAGRARNKIPPPPPLPLRTEFPVFWEFLIPKNSQKFPIMQITPANWIPSFLGIPRNSQGWCINHSWWYLDFWRGVCSGRSTDRSWQQFPLLNAEVPGAEH